MTDLILASSSPYRRALLDKLGLSYQAISPDIDESPYVEETPECLVERLAQEKAKAIALANPSSTVIGSDQVAVFDRHIIGKPGSVEKAIEQLMSFSGNKVTFLTGLCVLNEANNFCESMVEPFHVHFRDLEKKDIESYIEKEMPLDCAGSFKSEGLGIALFEKMEGDDPNALIGLPLIQLITLLKKAGLPVI